MDAFSIAVSVGLQYGVPLETFVEKYTNLRFEPAGLTDDPDVRMSASVIDYIFRRLALDHLSFDERSALGIYSASERTRELETGSYLPQDDGDDVEEELEALAQSAPSSPAGVSNHTSATPADTATNVAGAVSAKVAPAKVHSSAELFEALQGRTADAPMCFTCGTKMRRPGPASSAKAVAAPPAAAE